MEALENIWQQEPGWQTRLRRKDLPPKTLGSGLGGSRPWKTEHLGEKISEAFSFTLGQDIGNNVRETSVKAGIRTWDNKQCNANYFRFCHL